MIAESLLAAPSTFTGFQLFAHQFFELTRAEGTLCCAVEVEENRFRGLGGAEPDETHMSPVHIAMQHAVGGKLFDDALDRRAVLRATAERDDPEHRHD